MIRNLFFLLLLLSSLQADWSSLAEVPIVYTDDLEPHLIQKDGEIADKINDITTGVIAKISEQIDIKNKNVEKLKELSRADYPVNKKFLFLVKKLNSQKAVSLDTKNSTTKLTNLTNDVSLDKFKKVDENTDNNTNDIENFEQENKSK